MGFVSKTKEFGEHIRRGQEKGLIAAANVVRNAVMLGLRGGYTSGNFVTGRVMNSVRVGQVFDDGAFVPAIRVGTDVPYALFWEVGHHNLYTRRFERVEVWRPAMMDTKDEQAHVFAEACKRELSLIQGAE